MVNLSKIHNLCLIKKSNILSLKLNFVKNKNKTIKNPIILGQSLATTLLNIFLLNVSSHWLQFKFVTKFSLRKKKFDFFEKDI